MIITPNQSASTITGSATGIVSNDTSYRDNTPFINIASRSAGAHLLDTSITRIFIPDTVVWPREINCTTPDNRSARGISFHTNNVHFCTANFARNGPNLAPILQFPSPFVLVLTRRSIDIRIQAFLFVRVVL